MDKVMRPVCGAYLATTKRPQNKALNEMTNEDICAALNDTVAQMEKIASEITKRTGFPVSVEVSADIEAARGK